jgi:hypothetical protein
MELADQVAEPCFKAVVASLAVRRRMLAFAEGQHAEHRPRFWMLNFMDGRWWVAEAAL